MPSSSNRSRWAAHCSSVVPRNVRFGRKRALPSSTESMRRSPRFITLFGPSHVDRVTDRRDEVDELSELVSVEHVEVRNQDLVGRGPPLALVERGTARRSRTVLPIRGASPTVVRSAARVRATQEPPATASDRRRCSATIEAAPRSSRITCMVSTTLAPVPAGAGTAASPRRLRRPTQVPRPPRAARACRGGRGAPRRTAEALDHPNRRCGPHKSSATFRGVRPAGSSIPRWADASGGDVGEAGDGDVGIAIAEDTPLGRRSRTARRHAARASTPRWSVSFTSIQPRVHCWIGRLTRRQPRASTSCPLRAAGVRRPYQAGGRLRP